MTIDWKSELKQAEAVFGKGAKEEQIKKAEAALGLVFPPEYRAFLSEVGWAEIDTEFGPLSIAGLGDAPKDLQIVSIAKEARLSGVEPHWLPIADEGDFLFLDTRPGQGAIVYLEQNEARPLAESFSDWLLSELEE
jgi:cell wall assembly regulator SMI1